MAESKATAPDYTLTVDVDMTAGGRAARAPRGRRRAPAVVNDMVVKAAANALREHPRVNGAYRDGKFELYSRVNIGLVAAGAGRACRPDDLRRRPQVARPDRARGARAGGEGRATGKITLAGARRRHVHGLEPRRVRHRRVHRRHQAAAGGDPRRRGAEEARRRSTTTAASSRASSCGSRSSATSASSTAPTPPSSSRACASCSSNRSASRSERMRLRRRGERRLRRRRGRPRRDVRRRDRAGQPLPVLRPARPGARAHRAAQLVGRRAAARPRRLRQGHRARRRSTPPTTRCARSRTA